MYSEKDVEYKKPRYVTNINGIDLYEAYTNKRTLVSKCGKIFSTCSGEFKKTDKINGYIVVRIGNKRICVHRIVAYTFIKGGRKNKVVNHKDFDKTNNRVENLEWVTYLENLEHALKNGRIDQKKFDEFLKNKNNTRE